MQVPANSKPSPDASQRQAQPTGRLWSFSLGFYAVEGAAPACLELQDRHGCDVNMALFCLWLASDGFPLSAAPDLIPRATALSTDWADRAVRPLRAIRRDLKAGAEGVDWPTVREAVKAVELQAEKAQQFALERLAAAVAPMRAARNVDVMADCAVERDAAAAGFFEAYASVAKLSVRAESPPFLTIRGLAQVFHAARSEAS